MVAFDHFPADRARLDDVGINRSLGEIFGVTEFGGFGLENPDEFFSDYFTLFLGVGNAHKLEKKLGFGIDAYKCQITVLKGGFDLIALIFTHETGVDKYTDEPVADGLGKQRRKHRGVDSARKTEQHLAISDLLADLLDAFVYKGLYRPIAGKFAGVFKKRVKAVFALAARQRFHRNSRALSDLENRNSQFVDPRKLFAVNERNVAEGAGDDNALGLGRLKLFRRDVRGEHLAEHIAFSDSPCHRLSLRASHGQHNHFFVFHIFSSVLALSSSLFTSFLSGVTKAVL